MLLFAATPTLYFQLQTLNFKFSDYVYNPKEARIRKAMREATRERSIGASHMVPRPNARRAPSHSWATQHNELCMVCSFFIVFFLFIYKL